MSILDIEKIERCKRLLLKEYFRTSIIEAAVKTVDYTREFQSLQFEKFGRWTYILREWFTDPTFIPDYVFTEIGGRIAIGEENYIVQQLLTHREVTSRHIEKFDYEILV